MATTRELSDDEVNAAFKESIGKPEFLQCSKDARVGGYAQDKQGCWWAFFGNVENNFYGRDSAARLRIDGDVIEVALRARFVDEERSGIVPAGEAPVVSHGAWEKANAAKIGPTLGEPSAFDWSAAVKLPFKPRELRFVDR